MVQIVLIFLVCLQLANFFCLVSNVLWLCKIYEGIIAELSIYTTLYGVAFLVNIVVSIFATSSINWIKSVYQIHLPWFIMVCLCGCSFIANANAIVLSGLDFREERI